MRDRIAKDAEPNRRINVARCLSPFLEVSQRVALGGWVGFHFRKDIERSTDILSVGPAGILPAGSFSTVRDARLPHGQNACATLSPLR